MLSLFGAAFVASHFNIAQAANPTILVYGDSLSAAYGIAQQASWPVLLQSKLKTEQYPHTVVNASISGETTSGGLSRLQKTLANTKPSIVILELGANDGLRGLPVNAMTANIQAMIAQVKKTKAQLVLIGMRIPPNYGPKYTDAFSATYKQLAQQHKLPLVPFMLDKVAAQPQLLLQDGLHPNAEAQPLILENIWPHLKPLLK